MLLKFFFDVSLNHWPQNYVGLIVKANTGVDKCRFTLVSMENRVYSCIIYSLVLFVIIISYPYL